MDAQKHFAAVAPGYMAKLLRDFPELGVLDAAAIFGNLGHESGGLATLQEITPTVKGSRGGYGWPQWTGPRRRAYEAYCKRNNLDPASDAANYAYLFIELKGIEGSEKGAIKAVLAASTLDAKVKAFEKAFLRAGVKHYPSRVKWAERALDAWKKAGTGSAPEPDLSPAQPRPQAEETRSGGSAMVIFVSVVAVAAVLVWFVFFKR